MTPTNAPAGPPPGYAGPAPSAPMTVGPVSASPKKSDDDDDEWSLEHLAPDYTWKEFKKAVGWGPDQQLAREAYDRGQALFNAKNYDEAAKEFYTASWRWPDSTMEEDAMFLEGESYFFSDHYGRCPGLVRQFAEEARQHALPGHGRRPACSRSPPTGSNWT